MLKDFNLDKNIIVNPLDKEMESAYLSYAMSVIISRALPDARDGLKPVHRRVLFTMLGLDLKHNTSFKKSARIVGDVMGKYHPHGDSAIYETMVRMAQPWSMRGVLVDGQGNFGSIDGDSAAAYRYTEARMTALGEEMLEDINKNTVDFQDNFDGSLREPVVLPAKFPNLLVNGSDGIAVGMATKIPPHNLAEIIDACILLIDRPNSNLEDLLSVVKGPDFPTGAFIIGDKGFLEAYKTGRGRVVMRSKTSFEEIGKDRYAIVVNEIPYQVNKLSIITSIADLVKDKKIEGISDIRDESDKKGIRVVIDLKRGENPELVLNNLYKQTALQTSFGMNMVALVQGRPEILNLERCLNIYLSHRVDVTTRRTRFDLEKAESRHHILQGYVIVLEDIEKAVQIIKSASNNEEAREKLIQNFNLSETQAKNVLNMRLSALTNMEIQKIKDEIDSLEKEISYYTELLSDRKKLMGVIKKELKAVKTKFGTDRLTEVLPDESDFNIRDLVENVSKVISITNSGYIKATPLDEYTSQNRGGKGSNGLSLKDEDFVSKIFVADNFDYVMFFTNRGRCFSRYTYSLPEGSKNSRGKAIVNVLNLDFGEKITTVIPIKSSGEGEFDNGDSLYVTMATKFGLVKKTVLSKYLSSKRDSGILAIKFASETDEVVAVRLSDNSQDLVLGTYFGKAIRFNESHIKDVGRVSQGVRGISLVQDDYVVGMEIISQDVNPPLFVITELGYGKKTNLKEYRITNRGGKGVANIKVNPKIGNVVGFMEVSENEDLILASTCGKLIRVSTTDVPTYGRNTQGVKIIKLGDKDTVVSVSKSVSSDENIEETEV